MISILSKQRKKNLHKKDKKINSMAELIKMSAPYKKTLFIALIFVILVNVAVLIKPFILKLIIDDFLVGKKVQSGFYSITSFGLIYLFISLSSSFMSYSQSVLVNTAGQKIIKTLRERVFRTIQLLPLTYLDKTNSGRLITRATNDVSEISEMYTDVVINLFKDVILLIGLIYAMLAMNVELALVSFIVLPFMILLVHIIKNKIKENFFTMKHIIGKINGFMAENISGMKVIQIFRAEKEKEKEFSNLNAEYFDSTMIQVRLNSVLRPAADIFQSLATAILIWYGMNKILGNNLEIGVLYAFTTYIKQFFNPISDLSEKYNTIQSALVSTERIFDLLQQEPNLENLEIGQNVNRLQGFVEFRNVWFSYKKKDHYDEKDWVLKNVSFTLDKGKSAAFVGETGAGKTTIISLISGFYEIQKGDIFIDGINIKELSKASLRRNISMVLQDVFLFSGNIRDNITLKDEISEDILQKALTDSCLDELVNGYILGLDHPVMERGNTLSAGQRQLISFARALAHNPAIFILDEATSNIDTVTETLIQKAISNVTKEKTTIVIAHRLSTIKNSDVIFVMNKGEIVEQGNHDSLVKTGGYYSRLVSA